MHIGLIGGIGPAATDFYYRRLIAAFAARALPLELTIVHADTPTLLQHQAADDRDAQVAIYMRLTKRLAAAGAECVVVTSIAGHFCIAEFAAVSPLPVISLLPVVDAAAERAVFDAAVRELFDEAHVEAILLGGTDLALVYRDGEAAFPVVDAAALHVDAIVARACA